MFQFFPPFQNPLHVSLEKSIFPPYLHRFRSESLAQIGNNVISFRHFKMPIYRSEACRRKYLLTLCKISVALSNFAHLN
jgi:hypothetical protein